MGPSQAYYRRYVYGLLAAATLYVVTAGVTLLGARTGAHTEIFPVFSWDLFSVVPNETSDYGLRMLALDGRPLDPPVFLEELSHAGTSFSVATHMAIQELGEANRRGDRTRVERLLTLLRETYLGGAERPLRFELVRRRYDVLERYRDRHFRALKVVQLPAETP